MIITFNDRGIPMVSKRRFKDNGQMIAPATIARVGIMEYRASECGELFADRDPMDIVRVMTRAEDLFAADSLESYRGAPITIKHPKDDVTTENARELQRGHLDGLPFQDGDQLAAEVIISDAEAINLIEAGVSDLSSGHDCTLVRVADEDVEALGYDAYKTNIRNNHVAIVTRGRAGDARIADEDKVNEEVKVEDQGSGEPKEDEVKLSDADQLVALKDEMSVLQAKFDAEVDAHAATAVKLADAEARFSDEAIQALVEKRVEFLSVLATLSDKDFSKVDELEAKRVVLQDTYGKDFADKDASYINLRFDIMLEDGVAAVSGDTDISRAFQKLADQKPEATTKVDEAAAARARMIERYSK